MSLLRTWPTRVLLGAVIVAIGIGVGAAVYFLVPSVLGPHGGVSHASTVDAMVTRKAACNATDPHDTVTFTVAGAPQSALLDACGNRPGSHLRVVVPSELGPDTVVAPAETTVGTLPRGYRRLGVGLLVLGCVGGAGYAFLVVRDRRRAVDGSGGRRESGSGRDGDRRDAEGTPEPA